MSAASVSVAGRQAAERLMTLTLTATSPSGTDSTDADGMTTAGSTPQGTTAGRVTGQSAQAADLYTRIVTVGGVERPVLQGGLHIPLSSPIPSDGWVYEVTDVGDADPALMGRKYHVVSAPAKSYATARRLDVVELP